MLGRTFVLCVVTGLGLATMSVLPAAAATKTPGLLVVTDLPGTFQDAAPTTDVAFNALVVDPKTCTETPKPIVGLSGAQSVVFGGAGTATPVVVSENVVSFPQARAARVAFAMQSKSAKAAVTCRSVGFIPPGTTAAIGTVSIAKVKFAVTSDASFATSVNAAGTTVLTNFVTFLHGPSLVTVGASAGPDGLSAADLKTIVGRARKRLKA